MTRKKRRTDRVAGPVKLAAKHPDIVTVARIGMQQDYPLLPTVREEEGFTSIGLHLTIPTS